MNARVWLLSLCFFSALATGQDRSIQALTPDLVEIWKKHAVGVDGSITPSAIPYGIATERAFWTFFHEQQLGQQTFQHEIRTRFTATDADVARIAQIAAQSQTVAATVRNDSLSIYDEICRDIVSADLNALNARAFAERLTEVAAKEAERLSAHYRGVISELSEATRAALDTYVDSEIRPQMRWGQDLIGLASEVPLAFLSHRKQTCSRQLNLSADDRVWRVHSRTQTVVPSQDE